MTGATCVVLGQCLAGLCTTFAPFLICQGVVFGVGTCDVYTVKRDADKIGLFLVLVPSQPLMAHWFTTRLSFAQGIAAAGSGLGGLILSNTTRVVLEHPKLGVKYALIINGGISGIVLFPTIALLRGRHKAIGARSAPYEPKWFIHPGYIWVLSWAFFSSKLCSSTLFRTLEAYPNSTGLLHCPLFPRFFRHLGTRSLSNPRSRFTVHLVRWTDIRSTRMGVPTR